MKAYKVVIEGLFVRLPSQDGLFGFFSTTYVRAETARQAANQACEFVRQKVESFGGKQSRAGEQAVTLYIKDIWEIEGQAFKDGNSSGATFYPMSSISKIATMVRLIWLRRFRPHLLHELTEA